MVLPRKNSVFADSNYFVALRNPSDAHYKKAVKYTERLATSPRKLIISNYIFSEVVTIVSQRLGKSEAIRAGEELLRDQDIEIFQTSTRLENRAWKIFTEIKKKNMSYVDCTNLAIMKTKKIKALLTFDQKDFSGLRKKYDFDFFS